MPETYLPAGYPCKNCGVHFLYRLMHDAHECQVRFHRRCNYYTQRVMLDGQWLCGRCNGLWNSTD